MSVAVRAAAVVACLTLVCLAGCANGRSSGSLQPIFTNPFRTNGVYWTILCAEWRGSDRRRLCEQAANALRQTPGIDPRRVFSRDDEQRSRLYYGRYWRPEKKETGKLDRPPEMLRDAAIIKDLAVNGSRFFIESRLMPYPTPDVGRPEWQLLHNPGVYSLRIAIFYPAPGFDAYKKTAADFCAELRRRGYEAYYRHGDFTSEVFVGSFGEDALVRVRKQGVLAAVPGQEVLKLQRNELFRYELHNCKALTAGGERERYLRASRVMPVHEEAPDDEYDY